MTLREAAIIFGEHAYIGTVFAQSKTSEAWKVIAPHIVPNERKAILKAVSSGDIVQRWLKFKRVWMPIYARLMAGNSKKGRRRKKRG